MKKVVLDDSWMGVCDIADAHFRDKYNFPIEDVPQKFFDFLLNLCLQKRIFPLFNGDASEKRTLSAGLSKFLAQNLRKFTNNGIPVLFNCGNHEVIDHGNNTFLSQYDILTKGIYVFNHPGRVKCGSVVLDILPYMSNDSLRDVLRLIKPPKNKDGYLFGHFAVRGAYYIGAKSIEGIEVDELQRLGKYYKYIFLSHFHKRQLLTRNCGYTGIPFHSAFEDEGLPTGVNVLSFKDGTITREKFKSPKFKTINIGSKSDITEDIFDQKNNIVKVVVIGTQKTIAKLDIPFVKEQFEKSKARLVLYPPPIIQKEIKYKIDIKATMTGEEVIELFVDKNCPSFLPKDQVLEYFKNLYIEAKALD